MPDHPPPGTPDSPPAPRDGGCPPAPPRAARIPGARGFTLIELVVVFTIVAVLAAAAIPSFQGLKDEQVAREPVAALARMAKEARLRAIREKHPYQIAFTEKGFSATRYLSPYLQAAELDRFLAEAQLTEPDPEDAAAEEPPTPAGSPTDPAAAPPPAFKEWTESYTLPEGTLCTVQFWHEVEPTQIAGAIVKLWVFQPSGICPPLTVRMEHERASFEVGFSALTADLISEKSEIR